MDETQGLFKDYTVKDCSFICGDFNEKLNKDSKLLKLLIDKGFTINEEM